MLAGEDDTGLVTASRAIGEIACDNRTVLKCLNTKVDVAAAPIGQEKDSAGFHRQSWLSIFSLWASRLAFLISSGVQSAALRICSGSIDDDEPCGSRYSGNECTTFHSSSVGQFAYSCHVRLIISRSNWLSSFVANTAFCSRTSLLMLSVRYSRQTLSLCRSSLSAFVLSYIRLGVGPNGKESKESPVMEAPLAIRHALSNK